MENTQESQEQMEFNTESRSLWANHLTMQT